MSASKDMMNEVQQFEDSVQKLSRTIGSAGGLWKDQKFAELSRIVSQIAKESRDLMGAGEAASRSVSQFESIAAERF